MPTCRTKKWMRVTYSAPVTRSVRRLRVLPPASRGGQRVVSSQWLCIPTPAASREYRDAFGNRILEMRHTRIEREFGFRLMLTTEMAPAPVPAREGMPAVGLGVFLQPSLYCNRSETLHGIASRLRLRNRSGDETELPGLRERQVQSICAWVHQALKYEAGRTDTRTTASQALKRGGGVCQDYAHVMIALCRDLRIPARYVSGYNAVEGLMHAWVETLYGGFWHTWDPTHNGPLRPGSVFVACGRDYRDVSPLSGSYRGHASARLKVLCRTEIVHQEGRGPLPAFGEVDDPSARIVDADLVD